MTKSTTSSLPQISTMFSWNKQRQAASSPRNLLAMEMGSPEKKFGGAATELTQFEDEQNHLSYTSLRDLMPTSRPGSPVKLKRESDQKEVKEEDDLFWGGSNRPPIKNRLVEQAARAYLLPSRVQRNPPDQFLARYWARLTSPGGLQSVHQSTEDLWAPASRGCIHGCSHGCLSCLPSLLWVDLTRAFQAMFGHLRPPRLLRS